MKRQHVETRPPAPSPRGGLAGAISTEDEKNEVLNVGEMGQKWGKKNNQTNQNNLTATTENNPPKIKESRRDQMGA